MNRHLNLRFILRRSTLGKNNYSKGSRGRTTKSVNSELRFLRQGDFDSKMLWKYVKPAIRERENQNGVLILDDSIEDKPYTDENEVNCWHYSHAKGDVVKGINCLSCMVRYDDFSLPIVYEIIKKDIQYCDIKTRQLRRTATVNKNQHFRQLIQQACTNHVLFEWVLADNWFGLKANMAFIHHVYAAMIAYCKLEMLKFKTGLNHFAIKYKLIIRANQIAMQELKSMAC